MTQASITAKRLLFFLSLFIGLRVFYVFTQPKDWIHGGWEYDAISDNYVATGSMQMAYFDGPLLPTAGEAPGVSFVLIVLKKYFSAHYFLFLSLVQLAVTTATFYFFTIFVSQLLKPAAATWAIWFYLLDINLFSPVRWVNETLYTEFFFVVGVFSFWRVLQNPSWKRGALFGLCLGVGALFRPTFLLIFFLALAYLAYRRWKPTTLGMPVKTILASLVCFVLVLAPWTMRNYFVFKKFIPVAQYLGLNLWAGWNPQSGGTEYQLNGDPITMEPWLLEKVRSAKSETEINDTLTKAAIGYARQDPLRWARQRGFAFLFFWHEHTFWAPHSRFRNRKEHLLGIYNLILLAFFFASIPVAWKNGGFIRLLLVLMLIHSLIYTFVHADIGNRYRLQIEPLLLIIMGIALAQWCSKSTKPA